MGVSNLLHTTMGVNIISIILGFGVASLFHTVCTSQDCMDFRAPILTELLESTFQAYNDTCVKYELKQIPCNPNKKSVHFDTEVAVDKK